MISSVFNIREDPYYWENVTVESADERSSLAAGWSTRRVPAGNWQQDAACKGMDTRLFFPARGESSPEAESACGRCPVRLECAEYAIGSGQRFGIWGGTSERQRRRVRAGRAVERLGGAA